jgi:hypothetical protein
VGEPKSGADPRWTREQLLKIPSVTAELLDEIDADPTRAVKPTILETVEGFVMIATQVSEGAGGNIWWRGQRDSSWQLRPAIARNTARKKTEVDRCALFMSRARTRHQACPRKEDLAEWLFLMQHYSRYTRLLDWTFNPLTALYFAVEGDEQTDAAVYSLDPRALNSASGQGGRLLLPHHPAVWKLIKAAFNESEPVEEAVAFLPPEIDPRMLVQRSVFTIHGGVSALEDHPYAATFMNSMIVPRSRRAAIRQQLRLLGIDRPSLFPDLTNLAQDLNE